MRFHCEVFSLLSSSSSTRAANTYSNCSISSRPREAYPFEKFRRALNAIAPDPRIKGSSRIAPRAVKRGSELSPVATCTGTGL